MINQHALLRAYDLDSYLLKFKRLNFDFFNCYNLCRCEAKGRKSEVREGEDECYTERKVCEQAEGGEVNSKVFTSPLN